MKPLLRVTFIGELLSREFSSKTEASYYEVRCLGHWYDCDPVIWREVFLKACFLCERKLVIDMRIDDSKEWKIRMAGSQAVLGPYAADYRFLHQGFNVVEKRNIGEKSVRFTSMRMQRLKWDGKTALNDYENGVVVSLPLKHPQFDSYWKNPRTEERRLDEQVLLERFSLWQFAPLLYCQTCKRIHDGVHRWYVVRMKGWKDVPVRIARYGRDDERQHCRNVERGRK